MKLSNLYLAALAAARGVLATSDAFVPGAMPLPPKQAHRVERAAADKPWTLVTVALPAHGAGGSVTGRSLDEADYFHGIPYADPPEGELRLRPPQRVTKLRGADINGTMVLTPSCPQMSVAEKADRAQQDVLSRITSSVKSSVLGGLTALVTDYFDLPAFNEADGGREDCLTLNVQRPAGVTAGTRLPVLFWIFGGAFENGGGGAYDANNLFQQAVDANQPFIFVSINHRVAGFGFMPGKEVLEDGAANLGLLDQRMALEWVADNIAAFGGDPDKVTLWGVSSGGISVFDQMLLYGGDAGYKGKPLFRGAIVNSGGIAPAERVESPRGQDIYDSVVRASGCPPGEDSLACLRALPYAAFARAANSVPSFHSYASVALSYLPRPDGVVLRDSPERMVANNEFYGVPLLLTNMEDEGTILSLYQKNVSTADDMTDYLQDVFFPYASRRKMRELVDLYEPASTEGSPFRTTGLNSIYPGYKRVAAMLGDLVFGLSRRTLQRSLARVRPAMPVWAALGSYGFEIPFIGSFHALDTLVVFSNAQRKAARSTRSYYLNFLHNLDPNVGNATDSPEHWPLWSRERKLLWFETPDKNSLLDDDFRANASAWIDQNLDYLRL